MNSFFPSGISAIVLYLVLLFVSCSMRSANLSSRYHRHDWHHWADLDRDCQNTRHEILKERSLAAVTFNRKKCKVKTGKWADYYYPQFHTEAKNVDIDHLIPLKHAHDSGGAFWSFKEKERFANDPENLVVTDKRYNRLKGAKRIDQWLPVHREYACKYVKDWIKLKTKYKLKFTEGEKKTIQDLSC